MCGHAGDGGGSRRDQILPLLSFLCLLVIIPSGMHIFKLIFCVAIHILGVWVLLVFTFGLISCFSIYLSKDFLKTEIGNACFTPGSL